MTTTIENEFGADYHRAKAEGRGRLRLRASFAPTVYEERTVVWHGDEGAWRYLTHPTDPSKGVGPVVSSDDVYRILPVLTDEEREALIADESEAFERMKRERERALVPEED